MKTPPSPRHACYATARTTLRAETGEGFFVDVENQAAARAAGILAARRAGELLPYAADAEVEGIDIRYEADGQTLTIEVRVDAVSRKQVATRALLAASVCALTLVDLAPEGVSVEVGANELVESGGGLRDRQYHFDPPLEIAVLVVSSAVHAGRKADGAGEAVRAFVHELSDAGIHLAVDDVLPDEIDEIRTKIQTLCKSGVEVILCIGGTGLTHDDHTIQAIEPLLDKPIPGLMEAIRAYGQERTPRAFVSRGIAGLIENTLVLTIPGSTSGAREAMEALGPSFLHVAYVRRRSQKSTSANT